MPQWPSADPDLQKACAQLHRLSYGVDFEVGGSAPATWTLLGEHCDHIGGKVICALGAHRVAVVASKRSDDTIMVTQQRRSVTMEDDIATTSMTLAEVAQLARTTEDEDEIPARPLGGIAARLAGVTWTLVHRQFLSRETGGFNITVVSEIPELAGAGDDIATEVAWAVALSSLTEHRLDPPTCARLAEYCAQSAAMFSEQPPITAKYITALRGHAQAYTLIDYADGSVTSAPTNKDVTAVLLLTPTEDLFADNVDQIIARAHFADRASKAFGVSHLCRLPEASARLIPWLEAVRDVQGATDVPEPDVARQWLAYYDAELALCAKACSDLRARKTKDVLDIVRESTSTQRARYQLGSPAMDALVALSVTRGALASRPAAVGWTNGVIAHVPQPRVANFVADMAADGLIVLTLDSGEPADTISATS